jgi:hypothetical protein
MIAWMSRLFQITEGSLLRFWPDYFASVILWLAATSSRNFVSAASSHLRHPKSTNWSIYVVGSYSCGNMLQYVFLLFLTMTRYYELHKRAADRSEVTLSAEFHPLRPV